MQLNTRNFQINLL